MGSSSIHAKHNYLRASNYDAFSKNLKKTTLIVKQNGYVSPELKPVLNAKKIKPPPDYNDSRNVKSKNQEI